MFTGEFSSILTHYSCANKSGPVLIYGCMYLYECRCVCVCVCVCVCICMHMYVCVCMYVGEYSSICEAVHVICECAEQL